MQTKQVEQAVKKREREAINYVWMKQLYFEIADTRLFVHPYGPRYNEAMGKVFRWGSTSLGDAAEFDVALVKTITPDIFQEQCGGEEIGQLAPITVYSQFEFSDVNELVILARVEYNKYERLVDDKKRNGSWLILILYLDSATRIKI